MVYSSKRKRDKFIGHDHIHFPTNIYFKVPSVGVVFRFGFLGCVLFNFNGKGGFLTLPKKTSIKIGQYKNRVSQESLCPSCQKNRTEKKTVVLKYAKN